MQSLVNCRHSTVCIKPRRQLMLGTIAVLIASYFAAAIITAVIVDYALFGGLEDDRSAALGILWPIGLPIIFLVVVFRITKSVWRGIKDLFKYGFFY
ncbi:hypothetical protein [Pseudomonas phage vB_Pae_HMKU_23]|nr:hypothetical protein [Pseudomonas phage vB_Pae_HMKU_23]